MVPKPAYCIDTSALFDAGIRWYPPDSFPSFWQELDKLLDAARLYVPSVVAQEATHYTHNVAKWVKERQKTHPDAFLEPVVTVQEKLVIVTSKFPDWTAKGRNRADPYVVATAMANGLSVITGEHPSVAISLATPKKQYKLKIPNVCDEFSVPWLGIPDVVKNEGWTF